MLDTLRSASLDKSYKANALSDLHVHGPSNPEKVFGSAVSSGLVYEVRCIVPLGKPYIHLTRLLGAVVCFVLRDIHPVPSRVFMSGRPNPFTRPK